jgi:hypothetical protein
MAVSFLRAVVCPDIQFFCPILFHFIALLPSAQRTGLQPIIFPKDAPATPAPSTLSLIRNDLLFLQIHLSGCPLADTPHASASSSSSSSHAFLATVSHLKSIFITRSWPRAQVCYSIINLSCPLGAISVFSLQSVEYISAHTQSQIYEESNYLLEAITRRAGYPVSKNTGELRIPATHLKL